MDNSNHMLIKGCCAGDRSSQEMLYQLFARRMMGVCMWYAGNRQEAEEILQDGFVKVFRYINKYSGHGSLEGWIRRIMINSALYRLKSKVHLKPLLQFDNDTADIPVTESILNNLDEKDLLAIIQKLSPVYRIVFILHVMHGMKHREIASILRISENTSKSNLADARMAIQKLIKQHSIAYLPRRNEV